MPKWEVCEPAAPAPPAARRCLACMDRPARLAVSGGGHRLTDSRVTDIGDGGGARAAVTVSSVVPTEATRLPMTVYIV